MTEAVRVIIREKPSLGEGEVVIRNCDLIKNRIYVEDRPFAVGQFFNCHANQEHVYTSIQPLVKKFLEGYCCSVMAYGQSGTGKSFTMGLESENFENSNSGIVHRALHEITKFAQEAENETAIELSFLEIYNEKVFDLLSDKIDEPINKGFKFTGGVKRPLKTITDAELILMEGNKNRRTRPTTMNTNSSRSHGIVVVYKKTDNVSSSFYMVDLAGSEGVRRTGHKGEALTEGSHINRGLLGIGNIFKALSDGSCWIPYRDTVLGSVLYESLNPNAFSTVVICVSALKKDVSETLNSLKFAQKVKNLKNIPKQPIQPADSKKKQTPRKDEWNSSVDQENLETPIVTRRPMAAIYRPNLQKIIETPAPSSVKSSTIGRSLFDLQNSQLMDSPTVKECFEAMTKTLQKRNVRIASINFTPVDETAGTDSDCSLLNSTVIPNLQCGANENPAEVTNELSFQVTTTKEISVQDSSIYMTKEDCMRLVEQEVAKFTKVVSSVIAPEVVSVSEDDTFEFKVPENPVIVTNAQVRRRSVRILEKRKSIIPNQSRPSPKQLPPKRRRTTISKTKERKPIIEHSVSKSEHCNNLLNLLNKGDMKAIQVLPQVGVKTAYCIVTQRSLHGKFKNLKDVGKAPFWRGKAWERFQKANNLC